MAESVVIHRLKTPGRWSEVIAAADSRLSHRWRGAGAAALILMMPILQLAVNPNLFITASSKDFIDAWVYTGYFLSFPRFIHDYAGIYYGTRLPWILPGYALHSLFRPLAANYILHLGFFYALLFGLYLLLRKATGRSLALLVVLLAAWNPAILGAVSWDYVDGASIVFIVWTLVCIGKAADSGRSARWLAGAGAFVAAAAGTNLFLVVVWPVFVIFFSMVQPRRLRPLGFIHDGVAVSVGAVATLAALCAINHALGGDWLFFAPSLAISRDLLGRQNSWVKSGYLRFTTAYNLALPAGAALCAAWACARGFASRIDPDRRLAFAMQVSMLAMATIWVLFEFSGSPVLTWPYYVSYLVPFSLMAIALQSSTVGLRLQARQGFAILGFGQALLLAVHWLTLSDRRFLVFPTFHVETATRYMRVDTAAALTIALAAAIALRGVTRPFLRWSAFVICVSVLYSLTPVDTFPSPNGTGAGRRFESIVAAHRFIDDNSGGKELRFWYRFEGQRGGLLRALASTYLWGFRLLSEDWPKLETEQAATLSGKRLVLLLRQCNELEPTLATLKSRRLDAGPTVSRQFGGGDANVCVVVMDPMPEDSR